MRAFLYNLLLRKSKNGFDTAQTSKVIIGVIKALNANTPIKTNRNCKEPRRSYVIHITAKRDHHTRSIALHVVVGKRSLWVTIW